MNKKELIFILTETYSLFPQYKLEEAAVQSWFNLFHEQEAGTFRSAMHGALKASVGRFPTPGAVQEFLDAKNSQLLPAEAWEVVQRLSRDRKNLQLALSKFPDQVKEAARLVGFDRISLCDWDQLPFVKMEFEKIYKQLLNRGQKIDRMQEIGQPEAKRILGYFVKALPGVGVK